MKAEEELDFGGVCRYSGCNEHSAPGAKSCARHLEAHAGGNRSYNASRNNDRLTGLLLIRSNQPRPDWMEDPSLLPKRPPGRAA